MPGTSDKLAQAASRYRAGRLGEAAALLHEVLARSPESPDALFFLGSIAADRGRLAEAEELLRRALVRRPLEAAFHAALGNALARAGRHDAARESYRGALALQPDLVELHGSLGQAALALGRHDEALTAYDRLLARRPAHFSARAGRARALAALGRRDEALAELERLGAERTPALALDARLDLAAALLEAGRRDDALREVREAGRAATRDPLLVLRLAGLFVRCGEPQAALPLFQRLLRFDPRPELRHSHAATLLELKRYAAAEEELRKVLAERPADAAARSDLGLALLGLDRPQDAVAELEQALRLAPAHWQARHNLGLVRFRLGEVDAARAELERACALGADDPGLVANLGYMYCLARDFDRGEALLRAAAARQPRASGARLSLYLLGRGRFAEGWDYWILKQKAGRGFAQPWWGGEPLAGRRLLVWSEQGIGDQVMYCNPVPDLLAAGARVVLECEPRLERLFARSFPRATVVAKSAAGREAIDRTDPELQIPMSRLAPYLRRSWEAFPRHRGYLRAAPERVAYWRARLAALGPGPKVGVSWAGGTTRTGRLRRSTTLADWLPLLRLPGTQFVSLQYGDCRAELDRLREEHGIELAHWQEAIGDYDETAALVSALDAVASVCTAVIHLSGALGRPTYVAVPWWPSWRYLFEGEEMPWYPSVRLVRQDAPKDWSAPVERIARLVAERNFDQ